MDPTASGCVSSSLISAAHRQAGRGHSFDTHSTLYTLFEGDGAGVRWMIVRDTQSGEMADGAIRYLTIRADVLMGLAEEWPGGDAQQFVAALERSVLRHSRDSFVQYQST